LFLGYLASAVRKTKVPLICSPLHPQKKEKKKVVLIDAEADVEQNTVQAHQDSGLRI
jgi:hypothetical protein